MDEPSEIVTPDCGLAEASCSCVQPFGHEGAHVCACGGSWTFDEDDRFRPLALPGFGR